MKTRISITGLPGLIIFGLLAMSSSVQAQAYQEPKLGIPVFTSNVPVAEGSLILLGESAERGVSSQDGLTVVDRRRLDAVWLAREEVKQEDYLNSNREAIAALGADLLLLGHITRRQEMDKIVRPEPRKGLNGQLEEADPPYRFVSIRYTIQFRLLAVETGELLGSKTIAVNGGLSLQAQNPLNTAPYQVILPQIEQRAADNLARSVRQFIGSTFQGEMQVVDLIDPGKKKVDEILVASTQNSFRGQELNIFVNEEYVINEDTLNRPLVLGYVRVKRLDAGLLTCKVLDGEKPIFEAYQSGQTLYGVPGDQKSHWILRMMTWGLIDKLPDD